jgi:hypothetical protein
LALTLCAMISARGGGHRFRVPDQPGAGSSYGQATSTSPI